MLKLQINNMKNFIQMIVIKNQYIKIIRIPQYLSDCWQILKCWSFHSAQSIALWLVVVYIVHSKCNSLQCGLNHYLWSILCQGLKAVPFTPSVIKHLRTKVQNAGTPVWPTVGCSNHCYRCTFFTTAVHTEPLTVTFNSYLSHLWDLKHYA